MSLMQMTANTNAIKRAILACQMAFGCLVEYTGDSVKIAAFGDDGDCIRDTLEDAGSEYIGNWAF